MNASRRSIIYGFFLFDIVLTFACVHTTTAAQLVLPFYWNCGGVPLP
jgi:hypothetical protein